MIRAMISKSTMTMIIDKSMPPPPMRIGGMSLRTGAKTGSVTRTNTVSTGCSGEPERIGNQLSRARSTSTMTYASMIHSTTVSTPRL